VALPLTELFTLVALLVVDVGVDRVGAGLERRGAAVGDRHQGEAARARALGFSWEETLAKMLGYYRALLAGTPDVKITP